MKSNQKLLGLILTIFAILLILILGFVKANFDSQAVFLCEAVSSDPNIEMGACPAHQSNVPTLLMVAFGIASIILASGIYLLFSSKGKIISIEPERERENKPHIQETKEIETKIPLDLNDNEELIYRLLKENKGSMYQGDIVKETGLSKVKVTRILDKLEHDDRILERKRRGMTNLVVLKQL